MNKSMVKIAVSVFLIVLLVPVAGAGEWIEYSLDSYSWNQFAVGDYGVGVAESTSNSLLFFNTRTGVWIEHGLDTPMSVVTIQADGFLVLVVGEDRAFAFNTINSSVHELTYVGSLLSNASFDSQSYDCGPELAMVVTDQEFCVFDAELNQWQRHAYSLAESPNYMFRHDCHDFYAVSFMPLTNGDKVNIVYSLLQHDFNEITQGMHSNPPVADYGFAGLGNTNSESYFVGYSAVTNAFSRIDVPEGATAGSSGVNWFADSIGMKTAFVGTHYQYSSNDSHDYHNYAYDTRHGNWQYQLVTVESTSGFGSWEPGGTFCSNRIHHPETQTNDLLVFDGTADCFYTLHLDLDPGFFSQGGNVVMGRNDDGVLGVDLNSRDQSFCNKPYYGRFFPGLNYLSYLSEGLGEDLMTVNCYNGNNNTWHHHTTGALNHEGWGTEHVQLRKSGDPQPEAIFYSAYRDEIYATSLAGWPMSSPIITDNFAGAYSTSAGMAVLYDAHRGSVYSWSGFDRAARGEHFFMTLDTNTREVKAYSVATGMWSYQTLETDGVIQGGPDLIGMAKSSNGYVYDVFYAYDASDDSWAVLHPSGVYVALSVREKTALYLSTYSAYVLGIGETTPAQSSTLALQGSRGAVEVHWEGNLDLTIDEVRLTARGPDGSCSHSWEVPFVREGACHFRALDNSSNLAMGGLFTYTLEVAADDGKWLTTATEKINLQPAPPAVIKQIYPNPFNPDTSIDFYLAVSQQVELCIYDLAGRRVRVLLDESLEAGSHAMSWDGCDGSGRSMASGVYSVSLETEGVIDRRKVILVR